MADNRKIVSNVRMPARSVDGRVVEEGRTFGPGQEDELAKVLSPEQGKRLLEAGALEGEWTFGATAPAGNGDGNGAGNTDSSDLSVVLEPLDENQVQALRDAGFDTPEAIRNASDEELDDVPDIGPATIRKIRELIG
jgi:hypothetical protein